MGFVVFASEVNMGGREKLKNLLRRISDISLYDNILEKYDSEDFTEVINKSYKENKKISLLSIKLANKIENDVNLIVFPIIFRTYAGRNLKQGGAFVWEMYISNEKKLGSIEKASSLIAKNKKLNIDTSWNDIEIYSE